MRYSDTVNCTNSNRTLYALQLKEAKLKTMQAPIRSKQTIQQLLEQIIPTLAQHIHTGLEDVVPLFQDYKLETVIDTRTRNPHTDEDVSLEQGNLRLIGLRLRLESFTRAGANTFDLTKNLIFTLSPDSYTVGPAPETEWLAKDYGQSWSSEEYTATATRWNDELVEELTRKLQELG